MAKLHANSDLTRVQPQEFARDLQGLFGGVRHPAAAPVVVRVVLELDVSQVQY